MEFFKGQESLLAIQWILRAVVSFFFLLFATKIMGRRSISQLRLIDFMMALLIGNIIAHPLSDEQLGLKGSMITMTVLVTLYSAVVFLGLRWAALKKFLEPSPFPLVKEGQIINSGLKKARISLDFLLSELRKEKVDDIQHVSLALWEPGGTLSIFLDSQHRAITPSDMQLTVKPFSYPTPIIKEGKIDFEVLKQLGKDELWLKKKVNTMFSVDINNVLLATIDHNEELKIFVYK